MRLRELFGFQGRVRRTTYALTGIFGVLLKHNLDRLLANRILHQPWTLWSYLSPLGMSHGSYLTPNQKVFLVILATTSIPFIWLGLSMTRKRLQDAGLPARLALLFFIPAANVLFFLILCLLPGKDRLEKVAPGGNTLLAQILPTSRLGISVVAAIAGAIAGTGLGWFVLRALGNYGWTLFLAIPFFMGFFATWLYSYRYLGSFGGCAVVALLSVGLSGLMIVGFALDGFLCVMMAAPIAAVLALVGAYLAYLVWATSNLERRSGAVLSLFLAIPLLASAGFVAPLPTPEFKTHTSIEISAPPKLVWQGIIAFPLIDAPLNPLFKLGVSYPLQAQIIGTGLTADRKCIFSSGVFREPILAWEEGQHFAFGVSEEPLLMKELSPYSNLHVRHLDDHDFRPVRADFYLTALPGGRTRLDGWTTYQNRMWPAGYWRLWTDAIVHQVHLRVFRQVKKLAEQDALLGPRD